MVEAVAIAIANAAASTTVAVATAAGISAATTVVVAGAIYYATSFLVGAAIVAGLAYGANALLGPDKPDFSALNADTGIKSVSYSSNEGRHFVYGQTLISGPVTIMETTGDSNEFLHLAVTLTDSKIDSVREYWINDEPIALTDIGSGDVINTGRFNDVVRIRTYKGTIGQTADPDFVSEVTNITSDDRGRGVSYVAARLEYDQDVWANGFSDIAAVIRGKLLYDPRESGLTISSSSTDTLTINSHGLSVGDKIWIKDHTGTVPLLRKEYEVSEVVDSNNIKLYNESGNTLTFTGSGTGGTATKLKWSDNWALVIRDWLSLNSGFSIQDSEIDDSSVIAAANISDEQVTLIDQSNTFTRLSDTTISIDGSPTWRNGDVVRVSSSGTLPGTLQVDTDYYLVKIDSTRFALASSLENVRNDTYISILTDGTGSHTITRKSQLRYTINGSVKLGDAPITTLEKLAQAGMGIVTYDGSKFKIFAGAAAVSTGTINSSDLSSGEISGTPSLPRAEIFNAARGTYINPDLNYTIADAPPLINSTYVDRDNGETIYRDFEFPFTDNPTAVQRLFKIAVERAAQGEVIQLPCKMKKFGTAVWDVETLSIEKLGIENKDYRVTQWSLGEDFTINLSLREEASEMWDWDTGEEIVIDPAPNTVLPDPFTVLNPPDINLSTVEQIEEGGARFYTIGVSWTSPADQFVVQGGQIEIQYKRSEDSDWVPSLTVGGSQTSTQIPNSLVFGDSYDVRIRSINSLGIRVRPESWVTASNFTVGSADVDQAAITDDGLITDPVTRSIEMGLITQDVSLNMSDGDIT